jgi:RimJ/RimL family protein N-acetyltransferase
MTTGSVALRKAYPHEQEELFLLVTQNKEWTKFNGPYFPYEPPTRESFEKEEFAKLTKGENSLLVTVDDKPVGSVSYYWECKSTRWLEAGIAIYDSNYWNKGIGTQALELWITHLLKTQEIERVGATTWSGNPGMIACAIKAEMRLEAQLRKVRYYQGQYYDSVKFGVLREEWRLLHPEV